MILIDNSAFARLHHPALPGARAEEIATLIGRGEVAVSLPFLLEAGYSARSGAEHTDLLATLQRLQHLPITPAIEELALLAQTDLARAGHHRVKPPDLIIAALAHAHGCGVLHYDQHFDVIASRSSLEFQSTWLAPAGSLV